MKKVFLAVLCLSLPVFASAPDESAPVSEPEASEELMSSERPDDAPPPPPLPYCWDLDETSCSSPGSTRGCTDGIYSDYVCTCRTYTSYPYRYTRWDCPEVR